MNHHKGSALRAHIGDLDIYETWLVKSMEKYELHRLLTELSAALAFGFRLLDVDEGFLIVRIK